MPEAFSSGAVLAIAVGIALIAYLIRLNQLFRGTPKEVQDLSPTRWSAKLLHKTYKRLESEPITVKSYANKIPSKLERRYIVTGGSGECRQLLHVASSCPSVPRRDFGGDEPAGLDNRDET